MTTTRQPSAHPRWEAFTSSFNQSNYITDFWNWFMTLMSKAAVMVLFGTVLYSGYQLLPGVPHVPSPIDAAVFVYALLDTDHRLSSYEIAAQTGYPPSTIQRYMKDWKARQAEAADEAADTAI